MPENNASVCISINGEQVHWHSTVISYEDVVRLCNCGRSSTALHTIVYSTKHPRSSAGTLRPAQFISVSDGMLFESIVTDNA